MTATSVVRHDDTTAAGARLPGALRIGVMRGRLEVRAFFRERQAVGFVFALPAILLVLLGSIFGHEAAVRGVTVGQLFTAGMIAGGIGATSFQNLGLTIAAERDRGTLKRLRGTPMPPAAYFIGKIIQVFVCTIAEVLVLIAVGMAFYHLHLPTTAARWWTFAWVFVLGTIACSLIGIGVSSLSSSATNSFPVITLPFLVLQFISGVYVPFTSVPAWLQQVPTPCTVNNLKRLQIKSILRLTCLSKHHIPHLLLLWACVTILLHIVVH